MAECYLVEAFDYEDSHVCGVFTSLKLAQAYLAKLPKNHQAEIVAHGLDFVPEGQLYYVEIVGKVARCCLAHSCLGQETSLTVNGGHVWATSRNEAIEKARMYHGA